MNDRDPIIDATLRSKDELVADYKRLMQLYLDRRPSGLRLKIANAIGKHRSFVSQITNPTYPVPIPARHLDTIFKICHFSAEEQASFLAAYHIAHPRHSPDRTPSSERKAKGRRIELSLPSTGDTEADRQIEGALKEMGVRLSRLAKRR